MLLFSRYLLSANSAKINVVRKFTLTVPGCKDRKGRERKMKISSNGNPSWPGGIFWVIIRPNAALLGILCVTVCSITTCI